MNYFEKDYPRLSSDLERVLTLMKESVKLRNKAVKDAIMDIFDAGGKMLRPAYLLLFSEYTQLTDGQKIALAASMEMLHTATLVHDDIIDHADKRRGATTISKKYGADVAVYAGDFLFVTVFRILSQNSLNLENMGKNTRSTQILLNGELGQMDHRYDVDTTLDDYIENISGKTGELFAMSMGISPLNDGNFKLAELAHNIGLNVGIAFQIMDDYLDYTANDIILGKPVLEDIKQGVYSAPVLYALRIDKPKVAHYLENYEFEKVFDFVKSCGALDETRALAKSYTDKALKLIGKLPEGDNTKAIARITNKLLERVL